MYSIECCVLFQVHDVFTIKEIATDAVMLFAPKLNPVTPQLATCDAKFTHNLLRIQFVLKY